MVEQMSFQVPNMMKVVNWVRKSGFTQVPVTKWKPQEVGEAPVAFECVVDKVIALGDGPGCRQLSITKVVQFM